MLWSGFRRVSFLGTWLLLVLLLGPGCGKGEKLKTYTVKGKVVQKDNKPFPGGFITFTSATDPEKRAYGDIAADGTFTLDTVALTSKGGGERVTGAVEAEYLVTIRPGGGAVDGTGGPPVGAGKGRQAFTLKKKYKIEAKENNEITVVME